jgi:uncharacterized protein YwgA
METKENIIQKFAEIEKLQAEVGHILDHKCWLYRQIFFYKAMKLHLKARKLLGELGIDIQ